MHAQIGLDRYVFPTIQGFEVRSKDPWLPEGCGTALCKVVTLPSYVNIPVKHNVTTYFSLIGKPPVKVKMLTLILLLVQCYLIIIYFHSTFGYYLRLKAYILHFNAYALLSSPVHSRNPLMDS